MISIQVIELSINQYALLTGSYKCTDSIETRLNFPCIKQGLRFYRGQLAQTKINKLIDWMRVKLNKEQTNTVFQQSQSSQYTKRCIGFPLVYSLEYLVLREKRLQMHHFVSLVLMLGQRSCICSHAQESKCL